MFEKVVLEMSYNNKKTNAFSLQKLDSFEILTLIINLLEKNHEVLNIL